MKTKKYVEGEGGTSTNTYKATMSGKLMNESKNCQRNFWNHFSLTVLVFPRILIGKVSRKAECAQSFRPGFNRFCWNFQTRKGRFSSSMNLILVLFSDSDGRTDWTTSRCSPRFGRKSSGFSPSVLTGK